jgi:hypothetical protein
MFGNSPADGPNPGKSTSMVLAASAGHAPRLSSHLLEPDRLQMGIAGRLAAYWSWFIRSGQLSAAMVGRWNACHRPMRQRPFGCLLTDARPNGGTMNVFQTGVQPFGLWDQQRGKRRRAACM